MTRSSVRLCFSCCTFSLTMCTFLSTFKNNQLRSPDYSHSCFIIAVGWGGGRSQIKEVAFIIFFFSQNKSRCTCENRYILCELNEELLKIFNWVCLSFWSSLPSIRLWFVCFFFRVVLSWKNYSIIFRALFPRNENNRSLLFFLGLVLTKNATNTMQTR